MSWVEKIKTGLTITCGDGKQYTPNWMNAKKAIEYNVSEFDFPNIPGTLIKRELVRGRKYSIRLFFQGDDHLDVSEAFEMSARDSRPMILKHPFYGRLVVQPLGFDFDNSQYNITEITGTVVETILEDYPTAVIDPKEEIKNNSITTNGALALSAYSEIQAKGVKPATITRQKSLLEKINAANEKIININSDTEEYYNVYNKAYASIDAISLTPAVTVSLIQSVITAPVEFSTGVTSKLNTLSNNLQSMIDSLVNVLLIDKYMFEANAGTVITAMCQASAAPTDTDYANRDDVLLIIDQLLTAFNTYIDQLDSLQTGNGGAPDSYIPNAEALQGLSNLVNFTLSELFNIAESSKQQRSIILEYDSNWILLAHRFYGLKTDDSTITELMEQNTVGPAEVLQVMKNRKVVYYV